MSEIYEPEQPTLEARKKCAEWLAECLSTGWKKEDLPGLEKIWWEYRDNNGILKPYTPQPDKYTSLRLAVVDWANEWGYLSGGVDQLASSAGIEFKNGQWALKEKE